MLLTFSWNGWMDGEMNEWKDERRRMDGWMDGWMDGIDGWRNE